MDVIAWGWIAAAAACTSLANIFLKQARISHLGHGAVPLLFSPMFLAGLGSYGFSLLCFTKGLSTIPISAAYPVQAGFAFIFVTMLSYVFLHEPLGVTKIAGLVLILGGITLTTR